jgi:hypothetical protein
MLLFEMGIDSGVDAVRKFQAIRKKQWAIAEICGSTAKKRSGLLMKTMHVPMERRRPAAVATGAMHEALRCSG